MNRTVVINGGCSRLGDGGMGKAHWSQLSRLVFWCLTELGHAHVHVLTLPSDPGEFPLPINSI